MTQGRHADLRQDPHWQDDQSLAEWLPLQQVSASHDKFGSDSCVDPDTRLGRGHQRMRGSKSPRHTGGGSWRPCGRPAPAGALNANLTSRAAITSPSTSTLPHAKLSPRHSSTLYDARGTRLRLTRGKASKYSSRLKQAQTTRGEGQASRKEQFNLKHPLIRGD
jgi:hypothetical protein